LQQTGLTTIKNKEKPKLGYLSVRVNYWDKRLNVEIISASDLTASNDSFTIWDICKKKPPSNDPFVEIELQPTKNFTNVRFTFHFTQISTVSVLTNECNPCFIFQARKSVTETRWKTVNPIYNETFQWDVTLAECLKESSVIIFTVKDYDYLSQNDFLGEAIVPLSMVRVKSNSNVSSEQIMQFQYHFQIPGVSTKPLAQPMLLHLRDVKISPTLQVLESRTWDPEAIRFTTEQFRRTVAA